MTWMLIVVFMVEFPVEVHGYRTLDACLDAGHAARENISTTRGFGAGLTFTCVPEPSK